MSGAPVNEFWDENKLPAEPGILVMPISMSRISNAQSAEKCWEYLRIFSPDKVTRPLVGVNFIYTGLLYFNTEASFQSKQKFVSQMRTHKNTFQSILDDNPMYIPKAFNFQTWSQICLEAQSFTALLGEIRNMYEDDKTFRQYVKADLSRLDKNPEKEGQIQFLLEESLLSHLILKDEVRLRNDYT